MLFFIRRFVKDPVPYFLVNRDFPISTIIMFCHGKVCMPHDSPDLFRILSGIKEFCSSIESDLMRR